MPNAYRFLLKLKKVLPNTKIIVTCHDVLPYKSTKNIPYKKIYDIVDFLLIHNEASKGILTNEYCIVENKIIYHPFPLINLELLMNKDEKNNQTEKLIPNFLFIGVMREEKGVQLLVDAWERLGSGFKGNLTIAGFKPDNVVIDFNKLDNYSNFKLIDRSLSDAEYISLISDSDYVVFPYLKVGNSGVLSTVISMKKVPIVTKLKVFQESEYINKNLMCEVGNVESLCNTIKNVVSAHNHDYKKYKKEINEQLIKNKTIFDKLVINAYKRI